MTFSISRRAALVASIPWAFSARAAPQSTRDWLLGTWRSDVERSLDSRAITPEQRNALSTLYGHLSYRITRRHFTLLDDRRPSGAPEVSSYRVVSETGSSIELQLRYRREAPITVVFYREADDWLFVRNRDHLEYYRRVHQG